jgi:energy-coupling factor transporter ATP-binding protein EcfA2
MADQTETSSPSATGGAGTFFEQHVGAYWLALLLVEACPPIFLDTTVRKVSFQTEHLGWNTDDALVACDTSAGVRRRIACQAKKAFSVGSEDADFRSTIIDAWQDFCGPQWTEDDAFAIITQRGTNVVLRDLAALLDAARASASAADLDHRLETPGFVSVQVRRHYRVIAEILASHAGAVIDVDQLWRFLRHVYVLAFDLNTDTAQTEAQIRTLLARTVSTGDPVNTSSATWNELLREASAGIPAAREYERTDLPSAALERHSITTPNDRAAVRRLEHHTKVILGGIDTKIGGIVHLPREGAVTDVMAQAERSRFLLLTGAAGSGKSAIAKSIADALRRDHFVFAFRAEEFAQPHVDAALAAVGLGITGEDLGAIVGAQPRKLLIIESVERILEASTRDAFVDLLRFVRDDPTWRLLITSRDYSVDLLRAAFFEPSGIGHATFTVPALSDSELIAVASQLPIVARLLQNTRMKALLRNAYVLQMAVRIPWSEEEALPETERDFRRRFWNQFVRAHERRDGGMPQRRDETFTAICVRRANALTLFAPVAGLDAEAVAALERDSLVVFSSDAKTAAAPAHDVLEDWGVLEWIEETYARTTGDLVAFSEALGGAPAIRRTYRTWVAEFLDRDVANADSLFTGVIAATGIAQHFRDDTIIAFLRSPRAPELLRRHGHKILSDDKDLFWRIVHLLRVGCVKLPTWASVIAASALFQPEGRAWASVLRLVHENLPLFDGRDRQQLLGLVEDWSKGVSFQTAPPVGHDSAAAITLWLIPYCSGYDSEKLLKRALSVLAKIPASDAAGFESVLRGRDDDRRDVAAEKLQELLFDEIEGYAAARALPDLVISAGKDYFLLDEEPDDDWHRSSIDIDQFFGMDRSRGSHLPPSSFRGPFRALLREHPRKGLDFILDLLNHAGTWYGAQRGRGDRLEPAWEVVITFSDGTTRKLWANPRLWNLFRGTSVTPYPLQSAAMALEAWLIELGDQDETVLDALLIDMLRRSDSVAVAAIAASLAVRHPMACGETLLAFLSSPDCIRMDRMRMVQDQTGSPHGLLLQRDSMKEFFAKERAKSDALPHRRRDLEMAITQLQAGPFAARVHALLDTHIAALPAIENQTEDDHVWRLALHRMDLRTYRVADTEELPEGSAVPEGNYVLLTPRDPAPELKKIVEQSAEEYAQVSSRLGDQLWAVKVFERAPDDRYDPSEWRTRLATVRSAAPPTNIRDAMFFGDAPTIVAAICVRDHWHELTADERTWCAERVFSAVNASASDWRDGARMPGVMGGTMPAAQVLPIIVEQLAGTSDALRALGAALTHPQNEVRLAVARAAGEVLWRAHGDVNRRAIEALRMEASKLDAAFGFTSGDRRYLQPHEVTRVRTDSAEAARSVIRGDSNSEADETAFDATTRWFSADALLLITNIALGAPNEAGSLAVFSEAAATLVAWWHADRHDRDSHESTSYETQYALQKLVVEALFVVTDENAAAIVAPILAAVDEYPGKVSSLFEDATFREDRAPATDRYWSLWSMFAQRASQASWLADVDSKYSEGKQYLTAVFLSSNWKETTRHWRSIVGHADDVHQLFERLPLSRTSLHRYLRFLYYVGEQSLPHAFVYLYEKLKSTNAAVLLGEGDSAFILESLLLRYVYAKPLELKRQHALRTAVLFLLDALVETGSSSAFRMRDDFVTPLSASAS